MVVMGDSADCMRHRLGDASALFYRKERLPTIGTSKGAAPLAGSVETYVLVE
jgi:hypothetical protein